MKDEANTSGRMGMERFSVLVDAYGAQPGSWPENEREAALELLESSERAALLFEEAKQLDNWLAGAVDVEPSVALQQRILEGMPKPRIPWGERWSRAVEVLWPFGPRWQPAMALGGAMVLGLTLGFVFPQETDEEELTVVAELVLEVGDYPGELP